MVDSFHITPNSKAEQKHLSLNNRQTVDYKLSLDDQRSDGAYVISYRLAGRPKRQVFGYYSNGSPLESEIKLEIRQDTVVETGSK